MAAARSRLPSVKPAFLAAPAVATGGAGEGHSAPEHVGSGLVMMVSTLPLVVVGTGTTVMLPVPMTVGTVLLTPPVGYSSGGIAVVG